MNRLIDKVIVFILCLTCYIQYASGAYLVVPVLCAVGASALGSWLANKGAFSVGVFMAYIVSCFVVPVLLFFLPLLLYDLLNTRWRWAALFAILPVIVSFSALPPIAFIFITLFAMLSLLICKRTSSLERVHADYIGLRDSTKELSLQLENKNKELMEKQDYEVNLAMLNERNRIARDIHDSIGHVLSNAILQTGALMAGAKDEAVLGRLETLKSTLVQGMDSVRSSIHNLHDESVDLYTEMTTLVSDFRFCSVSLDYGLVGVPDKKIKYAFIAIAKEALSNVARHSNATEVRVTLVEHPGLYQLVIRDNGTKKEPGGDGIGLKNIEQRVNTLYGVLTIDRENGFTVFASIPKEKVR